jgi:hypothetical protein
LTNYLKIKSLSFFMRVSRGLDHLLAVAFMSLTSCGAGGQEPKGSSEIVRPDYPVVPGFPMADPTTLGAVPNTAIYPAASPKNDALVVSEDKPSGEESLVGTYAAPSTSVSVPSYGNVQSFHATKDNLRQPKDTAELDLVLFSIWYFGQHYSSEPLQIDSLKPGIYEVRDDSLTRFLVVEEGGVVVGTMSYREF